jgi:hypothetical protein
MSTKKPADPEGKKSRKGFTPKDVQLKRELRSLIKPSTGASLFAITTDWTIIIVAAAMSWLGFTLYGVTLVTVCLYACATLLIASRQRGMENLV